MRTIVPISAAVALVGGLLVAASSVGAGPAATTQPGQAPASVVASLPMPDAPVNPYPTIDGLFSNTGGVGGGTSLDLKVTDRGGVPAGGVGAVALNVTITNPSAASYLTAYPTGATRPTAANLVFRAGQTIPNMVIVKVGTAGQVSLFNYRGVTDVVVDVLGWFPSGAAFTGLTPARLLDTRPGYPTIDGRSSGTGPIGGAGIADVDILGRGGVPDSGVGAVALNVTVTNPTASSFLTAWPRGDTRPTAANLNFVAGQSVSNMVMAKVGSGGVISLFNLSGSVDLVVDVLGWFPETSSFTGVTPARLMDSRAASPTIDGRFAGGGAVGPNAVVDLEVTGRGGVPGSGVGAVALNVTVTNPTAPSFLTVFPRGAARPTAANLNFVPGQTVPNMVIVKVGTDGQISLYNLDGRSDIVVDVLGWFPDGPAFTGVTPARLLDSRVDKPPDPAFADRPFEVFVPRSYDGSVAVPLVLLLHGGDATGTIEESYLRLRPLAEARGYLYVHADAATSRGPRTWNYEGSPFSIDDDAYLIDLVERVQAQYRVDPQRIFLVGHSAGAFMGSLMVCRHADKFAALVSLAGATFGHPSVFQPCAPTEPVNILSIHGTADASVPYGGNTLYEGAEATSARWASLNGCTPTPTPGGTLDLEFNIAGPETAVTTFSGCRPGGSTTLLTINGGVHIPALQPTFAGMIFDFLGAHANP